MGTAGAKSFFNAFSEGGNILDGVSGIMMSVVSATQAMNAVT